MFWKYAANGHLEISASASRHEHRHWRRHRYRHCKKFLSCDVFILAFRSFLRKHLWWSPSKTLHLPGRFSHCLEQLFYRKLVRTSFWRKELHSRRCLRCFKNTAESCIFHFCKFLIKNPIRDHFLEIFCKF